MSRERSDSQLNAEAAAPERPLEAAIRWHRQERLNDFNIDKMVAQQPPTTRDANTGIVHQHEATQIGMNMSARLYRFVESSPPSEFPWHAAFRQLRIHCRRNHPYHRGADVPYWRGSLCQEAVRLVVIGAERKFREGPLTIEQAADVLKYSPKAALREAFEFIETRMDDFRAKAERRAREEQGHGPGAVPVDVPAHHVPSDEHVRECPNPVCRQRRAA